MPSYVQQLAQIRHRLATKPGITVVPPGGAAEAAANALILATLDALSRPATPRPARIMNADPLDAEIAALSAAIDVAKASGCEVAVADLWRRRDALVLEQVERDRWLETARDEADRQHDAGAAT